MIQELKEKANAKYYAVGAGVTTLATVAAPTLAFAEDATVASTLTTGVTGAVEQAQAAILAVLPQALVLMGVILGVTVGARLFKKIGR